MLRKFVFVAAVAVVAALLASAEAQAWGGVHRGYTHVGAGGYTHYGRTAVGGGYGYGRYGGAYGRYGGVYGRGYGGVYPAYGAAYAAPYYTAPTYTYAPAYYNSYYGYP